MHFLIEFSVILIGLFHKVEFSYPSMSDANGEIPIAWQNLPSLALPDGAHNVDQDVIYFLLPSLENPNRAVFGISCYRQMSAEVYFIDFPFDFL
uniref:AVL9/DENND6 domain-containing protein n=1 Tax=Parascaris equorum TaxID=6256 RepID=A0A914RM14_PAREQ